MLGTLFALYYNPIFRYGIREFCRDARVSVWQGDKALHTQTFSQLLPNDSAHLGGGWLAGVDPAGGALQVKLRYS